MPFFQNVYDFEFRPTLIGSDRQYQTGWKLKANTNRSDYMLSGNTEPYNLSGNNILTLNYCYDPNFVNYASLPVTISAASLASTTAQEVVTSLNSNSNFSSLFVALVYPSGNVPASPNKILIKGLRSKGNFRAYISNTSAETILSFNKNAPIAELPTLFEKYTVPNRFAYPNIGADRIIKLNPADTYEASLITAAGLNPSSPTPDWQLLAGSSDGYWFYSRTYTSGVISSEIKYPAGATAGFLAKKTFYLYSGSNLTAVMETPYVLVSGDLVVPPS